LGKLGISRYAPQGHFLRGTCAFPPCQSGASTLKNANLFLREPLMRNPGGDKDFGKKDAAPDGQERVLLCLKVTAFRPLILIFSPVWGFRPIRVFRYTFLNVPNPTRVTLLFFFLSPCLMPSSVDSNAILAVVFGMSASLAIFSISSALVILPPLFSVPVDSGQIVSTYRCGKLTNYWVKPNYGIWRVCAKPLAVSFFVYTILHKFQLCIMQEYSYNSKNSILFTDIPPNLFGSLILNEGKSMQG
jgi:hypothetical protein